VRSARRHRHEHRDDTEAQEGWQRTGSEREHKPHTESGRASFKLAVAAASQKPCPRRNELRRRGSRRCREVERLLDLGGRGVSGIAGPCLIPRDSDLEGGGGAANRVLRESGNLCGNAKGSWQWRTGIEHRGHELEEECRAR
jgi:hypothetical protein